MSNVQISSSIFSFTKHLWICNDVHVHLVSYTKCFGFFSQCKHVNKGLAWLLTAAPIVNTWYLINCNETN